MEPNKVDRLFAVKALEKRITQYRKDLEGECKLELAQAYQEEGTTQRRSVFFGKEAGTLSFIPAKEEEGIEYNLTNWEDLAEWLAQDPKQAEQFVFSHYDQFAEWWFERTGEVPEGISRVVYRTEKPASARLAVKEAVVFDKMGQGLEGFNQFLLEGVSDD